MGLARTTKCEDDCNDCEDGKVTTEELKNGLTELTFCVGVLEHEKRIEGAP